MVSHAFVLLKGNHFSRKTILLLLFLYSRCFNQNIFRFSVITLKFFFFFLCKHFFFDKVHKYFICHDVILNKIFKFKQLIVFIKKKKNSSRTVDLYCVYDVLANNNINSVVKYDINIILKFRILMTIIFL